MIQRMPNVKSKTYPFFFHNSFEKFAFIRNQLQFKKGVLISVRENQKYSTIPRVQGTN